MKADEITYGTHEFGKFQVSIQSCVHDLRPADEVDFFEVLVLEKRDGALFYIDLHARFGWFDHLGKFERKLVREDLVEHNARVDSFFYKIAMPTWRLARHSIPALEKMCKDKKCAARRCPGSWGMMKP